MGLKSILSPVGKKINKKTKDITQNATQRLGRQKKFKERLKDMEDRIKRSNI